MGSFILWLIAGSLIGWVASILSGRTERIGCLSNMIAGEVGAVIGGLIGTFLITSGGALVWAAVLAIGAVALTNKLFTE